MKSISTNLDAQNLSYFNKIDFTFNLAYLEDLLSRIFFFHFQVQLIFCINFTLSCTMFELIIFEIADTLERSSRYFHWYLSLYLTLFMVIIMTPLYLSYYLLVNTRSLFAQKYLWPLAGKKYI